MRALGSSRMSAALAGDVALAIVFEVVAQLDVWTLGTVRGPRLVNAAVLAFVAPPLAWRRRWPGEALVVTSAAIAMQSLVVRQTPPSGFLYAGPVLIGAYSVGAYASFSWRALVALVAVVLGFDGIYASKQGVSGSFSTISGELMWAALPLGMWLSGRLVRRRRLAAAAEADATRVEREREQRQLAALEHERARMARELHDVLAHSVSLMGVQAGAAEEVLARDPERTRPVLRSIQQISRDSVAELHRLLGMLRSDELEPDRAPQPRLDQIDTLMARMRTSGLPVELRVEGKPRPLPAGVELAAYRIVQEALTNALKHARPSRVEVVLSFGPAYLEVSVENDGVWQADNGSGHGLIGMNERVSLYGGRFSAGVKPGGSFRITAEIPLEAALA